MKVQNADQSRRLVPIPVQLPTTGTSGSLTVSIPFEAEYIAVLNNTAATLAVAPGRLVSLPPEATIIQPYIYLSVPIQETNEITIFWSTNSPLAPGQNILTLLFSNLTIPVQGGAMTTGGVAQNVQVVGNTSVNVTNTPHVIIDAAPVIAGTDGTTNHPVKTDTSGNLTTNLVTDSVGLAKDATLTNHFGTDGNGIAPPTGGAGIRGWLSGIYKFISQLVFDASSFLKVNVAASLPAGSNHIGSVNVDNLPATQNVATVNGPQAATQGIISSTAVTVTQNTNNVLINQVVNGRQVVILNDDSQNKMWIGPSGVGMANGITIPPGGTFILDVVPGSTITIYANALVTLTAKVAIIN